VLFSSEAPACIYAGFVAGAEAQTRSANSPVQVETTARSTLVTPVIHPVRTGGAAVGAARRCAGIPPWRRGPAGGAAPRQHRLHRLAPLPPAVRLRRRRRHRRHLRGQSCHSELFHVPHSLAALYTSRHYFLYLLLSRGTPLACDQRVSRKLVDDQYNQVILIQQTLD